MKKLASALFLVLTLVSARPADVSLTIVANQPVAKVSPLLYGLMTEEINHAYDGGLYAELVQNRAFLDDQAAPVHWFIAPGDETNATITLDPSQPLNDQLATSLRLDVTSVLPSAPVGVVNEGYWGIPVKPGTRYTASFYAKAAPGFAGPVVIRIISTDGVTVYAQGEVPSLSADWQLYKLVLKTDKTVTPTTQARLELAVQHPGTIWLGLVSLFPPTWKNQPNGFRPDLMQMLVDLKPAFLRFPGGNYLEGDTLKKRFDWKKTLGPISQRPGHAGPWGYRSTDGLGLYEFLLWCEDMKASPVLAVYAGYSLRGGVVKPGPDLEPYVQDALDEIEYVSGPVTSPWGAQRARDGHPAPFKLQYVEIGNEDWFDRTGSYDRRFAQFFDAIKAKYPGLKCISTAGNEQPDNKRVHSRTPDALDEHYYRNANTFLEDSPTHFDAYDRHGPEIFVGEWASYESTFPPWDRRTAELHLPPTPDMQAALGDAAWMAAMERNSDLVTMQCYAPLLVNVNGYQWRPDLIGYDALHSFGSPSYYAIRLFSRNVGDAILSATFSDGSPVQGTVTRESKTGVIYVKLVNPQPVAQSLHIELKGVHTVASTAEAETLAADPTGTNSLKDPTRVVPVPSTVENVQPVFDYTLPPDSITVLRLKAR
jgi:alpha-N-arabinofuranosidase